LLSIALYFSRWTMAATVWKGYITFGLVSIPIRLFVAARPEHVEFHQVHAKCGTRIKQQLWCPTCEVTVSRDDLVKGYEARKGEFLQLTEEELKKVAPASTDTMDITEFVKIEEVDPIYYDTSYYALPESAGKKPYRLLVQAMEKSGYAALAKVGMHRREYIVVMRPHRDGLALHTMHYPNEVRPIPDYGSKDHVKLQAKELEMATELVKKLAAPFKPEQYEDEYRKRLEQLVEAKAEGKTVKGEPKRKPAKVIDLMQALQKSIGARKPAGRSRTAAKRVHARAS
jgi:DNA end-binding protein Ku